jgi:flavorubredoxin
METTVHEIAEGVYRLSTLVPDAAPGGFTFNQFLLTGDEPLLFHCGPRQFFDSVSTAASRVIPLDTLRWISFGHVESDECGSMNQWLAAAPKAEVAFNGLGCMVQLNDLCDRPPVVLNDGEILNAGDHRLRVITTPHVPHGWEAQLLFDEATSTLLCGDLFTQMGDTPPLTHDGDIVGASIEAENMFGYSAISAATAPTIRRLADLAPRTLAAMHGASFAGDCAGVLRGLSDAYAERFAATLDAAVVR